MSKRDEFDSLARQLAKVGLFANGSAAADLVVENLVWVLDKPFVTSTQADQLRRTLSLDVDTYRNKVNEPVCRELDPSRDHTSNRYKTLAKAYAVSKTSGNGYDYGTQFVKQTQNPSLDDKLTNEAEKIVVALYRAYLEDGLSNAVQKAVDLEVVQRSATQQIAESGATTDAEAAESIAKDFSLAEAGVETVLVAVNVASAVLLGIELKENWNRMPAGFRAMDTITLVVTCAQAATGIATLVIMTVGVELAALPVVGVLVCLAGLTMMLVETFVPHPNNTTDRMQDYLDAHSSPYINGLDSPLVPRLQYDVEKSAPADGKVALTFTIRQSSYAKPIPMIQQLIITVYAGSTSSDLFKTPEVNQSGGVTNDILWSIVDGADAFNVKGNNDPDKSDHSLLGRVYPKTPAVPDPKNPSKSTPGTSIIGTDNAIKVQVCGWLNPAFTGMPGTVMEILVNPPNGVASTDVIWKYKVTA